MEVEKLVVVLRWRSDGKMPDTVTDDDEFIGMRFEFFWIRVLEGQRDTEKK